MLEGDVATSKGALVTALRAVGHAADFVYVDGEHWSSDDRRPIGASGVRNGSLLSVSGVTNPQVEPGTYVVVVGGPQSGHTVLLDPARPVVIGRAPGDGGVAMDDQLMSGRHLRFALSDGGDVLATDLASTNGSAYEGVRFTEVIVEPGCLVHAGSSLFAAVVLSGEDHAIIRGATATGLNLHRQFREALPELPPAPSPPAKPRAPEKIAGTPWWRSLMPLVTAVGMAWMFGRWQFLLIAAFAPIVYTLDHRRRSRQARAEADRDQAAYQEALERFELTMAGFRHLEVRRARLVAVSGGQCALMAGFRHRRVWERRPPDVDFLGVTLGYAALKSTYVTSDKARAATGPTLWQAPLTISLGHEGPLSITGPALRAAAVARSLLTELAFTHAPVDVNLWVFSEESRAAQWEFAQWLPHAFTDVGGALVGVTSTGRACLIQSLKALIETRHEAASANQRTLLLPIHVVVVDGVDNLAPSDLTELLRRGPEVGVIGIVTDPSIVPEGILGEVQLGRFDDECSYRSVVTPKVDAVTVSQLSPVAAFASALALAPLEAFGREGAARTTSAVYLTELLRIGERTAEEQLAIWGEHSPRTDVPIGVGTDGQLFHIDLVKQGPHGMIGGMTRSGKTEFLKTWISSLAMFNHPDDLAITIIDFKGGVDHELTAQLPHVIALATNQDIDLFERTVTLLTAEHERRQSIFRHEAGVSTLEGYRSARERRAELIAIPRLLVIVDEFVELLKTPEGHAQIGRLESIARIGAGLGVHLLLVTQDFTSSLPPQIDGQAGLRVCFKVGKATDSKTVLGSAAAVGISSAAKGRAFARFQGGEVVEFQSARVGNQARHLIADHDHIAVHHATFDSIAQPSTALEQQEVENDRQDLHRIVQIAQRAAARTGFTTTLPWPPDLPSAVGLAALFEQYAQDRTLPNRSVLVGVADDPTHQRQLPVRHSFDDAVVAYVGSAASGHHDALLTAAASTAAATSPDDLHIYGIDLVGHGLGLLDPLPHVGTVATRDDATAMRILNWLTLEASTRRATISRCGASDHVSYTHQGGSDLPQVMLLVLGADRMFLHGEGTTSPLLGPMTTIVNEVVGTGIQVLFSGTHPMLMNRLGTTASRRFVFAANDPSEYSASIPKAFRSRLTVAGRCVDSDTGLLTQLAQVNLDERTGEEGLSDSRCGGAQVSVGDVFVSLAELIRESAPPRRREPRRFTKAPWPLLLSDLGPAHLSSPPAGGTPLPFGVRPDTGEMLWIDPLEDGVAFRFIGAPKSGRSNSLVALGVLAQAAGWTVRAAAASRRSPMLATAMSQEWLVPIDELVDLVAPGVARPTLVLIDDAHRLDVEFPWQRLAQVDRGLVVTVVAGSIDGMTTSQITRGLRATGGVVLMPARPRDACNVGVSHVDDDWLINPLPGIGVAGIAGEAHRIQFPLALDATA
jgi:S-DNA-T family DNA segregation ATPase FtsK/SpoIIIE